MRAARLLVMDWVLLSQEDVMPLPRRVARLNRIGLNRVARHVAVWLP